MLGLVSLDLVLDLGLVLVVSGDWCKCGVMWMWWTHGGWCVVLLMVSHVEVMVALSARFVTFVNVVSCRCWHRK